MVRGVSKSVNSCTPTLVQCICKMGACAVYQELCANVGAMLIRVGVLCLKVDSVRNVPNNMKSCAWVER